MPEERFFVYRESDWTFRFPLPDDMILGLPVCFELDNGMCVMVTLVKEGKLSASEDDVGEQKQKVLCKPCKTAKIFSY